MKSPLPVFILMRTSSRPLFFERCMASVKSQTYPNIVTIVHTDDPNDRYITGDIIIRSKRNPSLGNGHFNLYCNALLEAIPKDINGWYHFIDDDDMYFADDVIAKLVKSSKRDHINVARVRRWNNVIFPRNWGNQRSYQTECFFLHTEHRLKARWWSKKGGDHHYSKQLTRILPINWIDNLIICKAQQGKGKGLRFDLNQQGDFKQYVQSRNRVSSVGRRHKNKPMVMVLYLRRVTGTSVQRGRPGDKKLIPQHYAEKLSKLGKVQIL